MDNNIRNNLATKTGKLASRFQTDFDEQTIEQETLMVFFFP
jgi:hypothetical protein